MWPRQLANKAHRDLKLIKSPYVFPIDKDRKGGGATACEI